MRSAEPNRVDGVETFVNQTPEDCHDWMVYGNGDNKHIVPMHDLRLHTGPTCWCNPTPEEDDEKIIVHHSADGREMFERNERLPS